MMRIIRKFQLAIFSLLLCSFDRRFLRVVFLSFLFFFFFSFLVFHSCSYFFPLFLFPSPFPSNPSLLSRFSFSFLLSSYVFLFLSFFFRHEPRRQYARSHRVSSRDENRYRYRTISILSENSLIPEITEDNIMAFNGGEWWGDN